MLMPRRAAKLLGIAILAFLVLSLRWVMPGESWRQTTGTIGPDRAASDESRAQSPPLWQGHAAGTEDGGVWNPSVTFQPGIPRPPGHKYSRVLVMAKMHDDDTHWVQTWLRDVHTAIYVADDPSAELHPPMNKGNEVMIYLTYIIDTYEALPEVVLFMHSDRWAWHNNEILNIDAVEMIKRLSSERVIREGYMNLRCHWKPGCPDWIHPGPRKVDEEKLEEVELARVWNELFPQRAIPDVLAQACCGQFALSRERILAIPKSRYIFYRDWLMQTELSNFISGRVWEYIWQYIFTAEKTVCPDQHACYCDGFGVCFQNGQAFDYWFELMWRLRELRNELNSWEKRVRVLEDAMAKGIDEADVLEIPQLGKNATLRQEMDRIQEQTDEMRREAVRRGNNPRIRAEIAGRMWRPGDGF